MPSPFKVIIVGGSVSGLTMAHALHRAGIDYVVLEKGSEIAFNGGASIGLMPHALRIMDQMGMYEDILATTKPTGNATHRHTNGKPFSVSLFSRQILERHGYPILFFEREELLQIMYHHFPAKEKILTSKRCINIESNANSVKVTTADGSVYNGDIVIGADGVHSTVRKSMWNLMEQKNPGSSKASKEAMFADYYCAFGVSNFITDDPAIIPGDGQITYDKKVSSVVVSSTRNRSFWFLIIKFDERKKYPNIPRFSTEETEREVTKYLDKQITEKTKMRDLWDTRIKCSMAALEEVVFETWFEDRVVLLGDAAHKFTPNAGYGGQTAVEGAAQLANLLYDVTQANPNTALSLPQITSIFKEYRASRRERVDNAYQASGLVTRVHATDNLLMKVAGRHILPFLGEGFEVNGASSFMIGGPSLKFVEKKGKVGTVPWEGWDPTTIAVSTRKTIHSVAMGNLQYLVLAVFGLWQLSRQNFGGFSFLKPPHLLEENHGSIVTNRTTSLTPMIETYVLGQESINLWIILNCLMNILPIGGILAVESFRANNAKTISADPWLIGITLPIFDLALTAPLYFFANSIETQLAGGMRPEGNIIPLKYANSLLAALVLCCSIPFLLTTTIPQLIWPAIGEDTSQLLVALLPIFPSVPWLLTTILGKFSFTGRNSKTVIFGHEDLPALRNSYLVSTGIAMMSHMVNLARLLLISDNQSSVKNWLIRFVFADPELVGSLRTNYVVFVVAAMIWAHSNTMSMLPPRLQTFVMKAKLITFMVVGNALLGPGAVLGLIWTWREDWTRCTHEM